MDNEVKIIVELENKEVSIVPSGTFIKGDKGDKGNTGEVGPQGLKGDQGETGKSAYQEWQDLGNNGTEQDFINSLKGEKGDTGEKGDKGDVGEIGPVGPQGEKGDIGLQGPKGENGIGTLEEIQTIIDNLFLEKKATSEEALAGTDNSKYITSYSLSSVVGNLVSGIQSAVENLMLERDKQKYHVGKLVLETSNTNPATYLGFGTWELWGAGRVPVGVDLNDEDFNEVEKTGGEKMHTLTVEEMPSHPHTFKYGKRLVTASGGDYAVPDYAEMSGKDITTTSEGGNNAHNNTQPYITCYIWKRVA